MKTIPIPYCRQETDYYCGPAVLKMVLRHFGIKISQKTLARDAGTDSGTGTFHHAMRTIIKNSGLFSYTKRNATIQEVEMFVRRCLPVIVNYIEPEGEGHYAIVVGYNANNLIFNDPWHGKHFTLSKMRFENRWHNARKTSRRWLMVVAKNRKDIVKI